MQKHGEYVNDIGVGSKFVNLLGNSPTIKVLDFFLTDREIEYSEKEIAENSEVSSDALKSILPELISNDVVVKTRKVGKQNMFRLNTDNRYLKEMTRFFDSVIENSINEEVEREKAVQTAERA